MKDPTFIGLCVLGFSLITAIFYNAFRKPMASTDNDTEIHLIPTDPPEAPNLPVQPSSPPESTPAPYLWNTPKNARHSFRVICDEEGLTYETTVIDGKTYRVKDVLCAVVMGESEFYNNAKNYNKNSRGEVTSTDYGIFQINDRYHIGQGKTFATLSDVLDTPQKPARFMIDMYRSGHIDAWVAHKNGSYKAYLPKA